MKSILVPTDFSDCAKEAVKMALAIAKRAHSHVHFLHLFREQSVVSTVPHAGHYDPIANAEETRVSKNLNKLVMLTEKFGLGATPVMIRETGVEKITDYISTCQAELIVMGSHGVRGIKEIFIGSNAQHVVRHSSVPVIVIKKIPDNLQIKNIVFASTFREDVTQPLSRVADFARLWNATVNLLFVNLNTYEMTEGKGEEAMNQFAGKFTGIAFTRNRIDTNDEEWGISQFVQMYPTDLIAVSRNEYSGAIKILSQSIAESLVNHETIPVMVV